MLASMAGQPYRARVMKMTMHIDEALLKRVMEEYECETKTEAVEMALREMDRRMRFKELGKRGMEMTPEEIQTLPTRVEVDHLRLVRMQPQPQR